jgi:acetyltransferase-like isoleucine patch superfamily enzyme
MKAGRRLAFALGRALDGLGLAMAFKKAFSAFYTLYKAKDLAAFGSGSTIFPFCIIQGAHNIRMGSGSHLLSGCMLQAIGYYTGAGETEQDPEEKAPELTIGDGTIVGRFCHFTSADRILIGRNVLFGDRVLVADHDHGFRDPDQPPRRQALAPGRPVTIGDDCWIGDGAAILPGASLGRHVVVGANAVVTGSVPDFTVVAGNPARPLRVYDTKAGRWVTAATKEAD